MALLFFAICHVLLKALLDLLILADDRDSIPSALRGRQWWQLWNGLDCAELVASAGGTEGAIIRRFGRSDGVKQPPF
jgi:hypothetical protein